MTLTIACTCGPAACGCCAGIETVTPRPIDNRPGLSSLSVRVGAHGDFLESMLARLSSHSLADGSKPLAGLRTRRTEDASIALLDAFAMVGDVLTFYNERIANEGYLRTATAFRSMREIARLVGYTPRPGVAASAFLAFTIDPSTATPVTIAKGARAQSVPGQDQLPQSFETSSDLTARAAWNALGVRRSEPQQISSTDDRLYLAGTATGLKSGDALLLEFAGQAQPEPMRVLDVIADAQADHTVVQIEPWSPITVSDEALAKLQKTGPKSETAHQITRAIQHFQSTPLPFVAAVAVDLKADIAKARAAVAATPPDNLQAWLNEVEARIDQIVAEQSSSDAPPPPTSETPISARIRSLAAAPSRPPASAARLVRAPEASFAQGAGANLQVLGVAAPEVGAKISGALAGYDAASPRQPARVWAMRLRAGLFGRAFPQRSATFRGSDDGGSISTQPIGEWPIWSRTNGQESRREDPQVVTLDAAYDGVSPGSWVMIDMHPREEDDLRVFPVAEQLVARVAKVDPKGARADYGGSGDTTAIYLPPGSPWIRYAPEDDSVSTEPNDAGVFVNVAASNTGGQSQVTEQQKIDREFELVRRTTVYARPEELPLALRPIETPFCVHDGDLVELDGLYADLEPGRYVIVSGERSDVAETRGVFASEVAMIAAVIHDVRAAGGRYPLDDGKLAWPGDRLHSFLQLAEPLSYCYRRETVVVQGNVVKATHGETRQEPLGGGDASKPNQVFGLKQAPLTYLASATARGADAALDVFVNDIRWKEVDLLFDAAPGDRAYMLRAEADGRASVVFGDGVQGARPSTGAQNVRAIYRTGIGRSGNLLAGQISQLSTRPLGVREVTNPRPSTGGADPESRDQVRRNAPLGTLALDRLVSVRDHADFARTFAGIAKARATLLSDGERSLVHLTVAAEGDALLEQTSDLLVALKQALAKLGEPHRPVLLAPRELRLMIVAARLQIDPDRVWEVVVAAVRARLLDLFGFDRRDLGAGVAASAVCAAIQSTPGVAYVDLDTFGAIDTVGGASGDRVPLTPDETSQAVAKVVASGVTPWIAADAARRADEGVLPAQLLVLSPDVPATLTLNEIR